jgi:hypothetical protein
MKSNRNPLKNRVNRYIFDYFKFAFIFFCIFYYAVGNASHKSHNEKKLLSQYQSILCNQSKSMAEKYAVDRWWLDHRNVKFDLMSPAEREAFVIDYAITTQLMNFYSDKSVMDCR